MTIGVGWEGGTGLDYFQQNEISTQQTPLMIQYLKTYNIESWQMSTYVCKVWWPHLTGQLISNIYTYNYYVMWNLKDT